MVRVTVLAVVLLALPVVPSAGAQVPEPVPTFTERLTSNVQAACRRADGPCPHPDVAAYQRSETHDALEFQYDLAAEVPFRDATWVGTHNSSNTAAEPFTVSGADHNQQVSMTDQLRMDVRSLEIDLHFVRGEVMVCHGRGEAEMHAGCTTERSLAERLPELRTWLDAHGDQVLLLYLEDDLGSQGHDQAAATLDAVLGELVFRPRGAGCTKLPLELTRAAVLAAGKQVVIVSGCGAGSGWQGLVFNWNDRLESRPRGYRADCGPDFTREEYDSHLVRYYEDSTVVSATAQYVPGQAPMDDGLTAETTALMVRCGVDLFGFDQLLPDDGRLDALVWSWAPHRTKCAAQGDDGLWAARTCTQKRPFACVGRAGWLVTTQVGPQRDGAEACAQVGGAFALPRTGYENAQLSAAHTSAGPWLAYTPPGKKKGRRR